MIIITVISPRSSRVLVYYLRGGSLASYLFVLVLVPYSHHNRICIICPALQTSKVWIMKDLSCYCLIVQLALARCFATGLSTASTTKTSNAATTCKTTHGSGVVVDGVTLSPALPYLDLAALVRKAPPIVYTIAGSDSGGGAGIQADLHAIHALGGHGCSAVTCLTAQSSVGVTAVYATPTDFLQDQFDALQSDLPPSAIKIGMLGTRGLAEQVGAFVEQVKRDSKVWVVLDPVMISTSGHRLLEEDAQQAMVDALFPHVDLLTPNKYEAEALLGRKLESTSDVEQGARDLLAMGATAVLIKGGHTQEDSPYAQDFFLSSQALPDEPRLCDGGVWLRSKRFDTIHTHGTGCTLSSALATALALQSSSWPTVADLVDATTLAKAYVTAGIAQGVGLGQGPGAVAQTQFPQTHQHFPRIVVDPNVDDPPPFAPVNEALGRLLILVDSLEWIEKLSQVASGGKSVTDIQLRIKGETDFHRIVTLVKQANALCQAAGIRLWVNDYWEAAIAAGCFGVHMGQEDLHRCQLAGGLTRVRQAGLALGLSTHSYGELAAALAVSPSYISLGPIFGTTSKQVNFGPQGLAMIQQWRRLVPPHIPLVVIGGINNTNRTVEVRQAGADCAAVIGAVTNADDVVQAIESLTVAMEA